MSAPCHCGGKTQSDRFDHPKFKFKWFLRCTVCGKMSDMVETEADTEKIKIEEAIT